MEKFGYKNPHQVPAVKKIVLNSGFSATADKNHVQYVNDEIAKISGQRPVTTLAKLSISNFKLREGQPIGCKVTLRGVAMYNFLMRLINISLPCIRDFRGVPTRLDGQGNYTLGISASIPALYPMTKDANSLSFSVCLSAKQAPKSPKPKPLLKLLLNLLKNIDLWLKNQQYNVT